MKVWITKNCLAHGIEEIEAEICSASIEMVRRIRPSTTNGVHLEEYYQGKGNEWHASKDSAIKKADEMKSKKISSLKNQLKNLEDLHFN